MYAKANSVAALAACLVGPWSTGFYYPDVPGSLGIPACARFDALSISERQRLEGKLILVLCASVSIHSVRISFSLLLHSEFSQSRSDRPGCLRGGLHQKCCGFAIPWGLRAGMWW